MERDYTRLSLMDETHLNELYGELDEDIKLKVKRGAVLLDERFGPNWAERVDLSELDMSDCHQCAVGQLMGEYMKGIIKLGLRPFDWKGDPNSPAAAEYGFNTARAEGDAAYREDEYYQLSVAWHREVWDRREV